MSMIRGISSSVMWWGGWKWDLWGVIGVLGVIGEVRIGAVVGSVIF